MKPTLSAAQKHRLCLWQALAKTKRKRGIFDEVYKLNLLVDTSAKQDGIAAKSSWYATGLCNAEVAKSKEKFMLETNSPSMAAASEMALRIASRLHSVLGYEFEMLTELVGPTFDEPGVQRTHLQTSASGIERLMVLVPCAHAYEPRLRSLVSPTWLVAESETAFSPLSCQLADTIVEAEQLRSENWLNQQKLDHSLYQITASFEELTWLRSLSEHFEICSLDDGLARAGQATLPPLRQLIYAQELFLFAADSNNTARNALPVILAHDGEHLLTRQAVYQLFHRLTATSDEQVIVWNAPIDVDCETNTDAIRNCILVPVVKANERHGWLLAVNKAMPYEAMLDDPAAIQDQNLIEFGTSEAGLMSTMAVMLATHAKNVELLKEKEELLMGVLRALVSTIDAKDAYTGGHSDRVATYSKQIAQRMGLAPEYCEEIYMSGLLHDIGKIGVPDALLGKPEKLTDEEYAEIKRHPQIGYEILRQLKPFAYLLPGVLHHHESYDGSGYPHGLSGDDIPLMGRIIAVADSYDAMTSNRTYRQGMPIEKALQILKSGQGKQWDRCVVNAFLELFEPGGVQCG